MPCSSAATASLNAPGLRNIHPAPRRPLRIGVYSPNNVFDERVRAKRRYRLGKRAETAAATRRRIVEATLTLHDSKGITRTSVRDVAQRADVAPATVLHHFPRMDDLIHACGELSDTMAPMPTAAILVGVTGPAARVGALALALYEWWEKLGAGWDHLQVDRRTLPQVDAWLLEVRRRHRELAAAALETDPPDTDLLTAITTNEAWRSMRDAGMNPRQAAGHVSRLFGTGPDRPRPTRSTEAVH